MDGNRFDDLTRTLARSGSRRQALKALAGAAGMGLGLFGRSSRSSAAAQAIDATSIKAGPLQGQANQDAAYRALRHYLQTAGFQPEGAAEAVDVFENGTWIASVLGRSYASRQSGAVATLAYVVTASGTVSLTVLASGVPYALLSVGADGGIVETPIPEPAVDSAADVPVRDELVHARIDRSRAMASAMSYSAVQGVSIQPALAQGSAICDNCQPFCEQTVELLTSLLCSLELWRGGVFSRLRFIGAIAARCAATTAGTPVCIAVAIAICGALTYIGSRNKDDICAAGCTRLGCAAAAPPPPPPPPPPTQCDVCQVLENGACVERTDCPSGCNPDTGACYPVSETECTTASDCPEPECQTCNEEGICETFGECVPLTEPCTADSDCPGCQTCDVDDGVCLDSDVLCPECQACVNGTCTDCPVGCDPNTGECYGCGPCQVIENGTCVERTDCPSGCDPDTGECYPEVVCGPCQVLENDTCVEQACPDCFTCNQETGECDVPIPDCGGGSGVCEPGQGPVCLSPGESDYVVCGDDSAYFGDEDYCGCVSTTEGTVACVNTGACYAPCESTADCVRDFGPYFGLVCAIDGCCEGSNVCMQACGFQQ